jgi:hypothetical protein
MNLSLGHFLILSVVLSIRSCLFFLLLYMKYDEVNQKRVNVEFYFVLFLFTRLYLDVNAAKTKKNSSFIRRSLFRVSFSRTNIDEDRKTRGRRKIKSTEHYFGNNTNERKGKCCIPVGLNENKARPFSIEYNDR